MSIAPCFGMQCTGTPAALILSRRNDGRRKYRSSGCHSLRSMWQRRCVICRWLPPTSISSLTTRRRLGAIERTFEQREQLLRLALGVELALDLAPRFGRERIAERGIVEQARERVRERGDVARRNEQ